MCVSCSPARRVVERPFQIIGNFGKKKLRIMDNRMLIPWLTNEWQPLCCESHVSTLTPQPLSAFQSLSNDQAYYQRAIASKGTTTVKAFLLGGIAWFSIPFVSITSSHILPWLLTVIWSLLDLRRSPPHSVWLL